MGTHTLRRSTRTTAARQRSSPSSSQDSRRILDAIRTLFRAIRLSSRACESASGRSSAQIFILEQLSEKGCLSVNEVAEHTFTHQSTVSTVVKRLIADGLVTRAASKIDARRIELSLTPKGTRAYRESPRTAQQELAKAIREMAPGSRRTLGKIFYKLVKDAGFAGGRPPLFFEETINGENRRDRSRT